MEGCIEWFHGKTTAGYGVKRINGKNFYAHRLAYCEAKGLSIGDIEGQVIRHRCDNPSCINPDHLLLGSHADNSIDMADKGRGHYKRAEKHPYAKLTNEDVLAIRAAYARGERYPRKLARQYGVNYYTIVKIATRKTWTSV